MPPYRTLIAIIALAALPTGMAMAQAAPNVQKGKQVFTQCAACHSLKAGQNGVGPSLHGLFGEKAGMVPGYNFSPAMKKSNVVWNAETLKKYLSDPQKFIPGNKMPFAGIHNETQLNDLIAYLQQATK